MRTFQRVSRLIRPAIGLPVLAALALAGLWILAMGCGPKKDDVTPPRLTDVPVPQGFKFNAARSADRIKNGFRVAEYLYEGGDASVRQVGDFYRQWMPTFGWVTKEENLSSGTQRLTFEKGSDNCYISIYNDWGTKIQIQLLPRGSRTPEGGAKPAP